jgi:hypothetical protein
VLLISCSAKSLEINKLKNRKKKKESLTFGCEETWFYITTDDQKNSSRKHFIHVGRSH